MDYNFIPIVSVKKCSFIYQLMRYISIYPRNKKLVSLTGNSSLLQKEMFAAKVEGGKGIGIGGAGGGIAGAENDRKLSNASAGGMKSKWVKAFKGIKGNKEDDVSDPG